MVIDHRDGGRRLRHRNADSPAEFSSLRNSPRRASNNSVHFSSRSPEWSTPQAFFDALNAEFHFTLDPCATHANAKCAKHYTRREDGLCQSWANEIVFMNPPYGRAIAAWMAKAHHAAAHEGAIVVCLVPARTDTAWWHDYAMPHEIRFLRGRLKFGQARHSAPFPSAIVIIRPA